MDLPFGGIILLPDHFKAIFFDLDGTLRHNLPSGGEFFADYIIQLGMPLSHEDRLLGHRWEHYYWAYSPDLKADKQIYREENGEFWRNYAKRQLIAFGASNVQAAELGPKVSQYMEEFYRPQSVVPDDVKRTLPILQEKGYKLAVISNRDVPFQQEIEELGLAPFFPFILAGGEVNAWKPEPDIFLHACRRLDVTPVESVYVGDNYFADVVGSRNAGLQPVLYDPRGIFPDAGCQTIKSFDDLPELLNDRLKAILKNHSAMETGAQSGG
jgi:putative hydrolase of the HAD superfamily